MLTTQQTSTSNHEIQYKDNLQLQKRAPNFVMQTDFIKWTWNFYAWNKLNWIELNFIPVGKGLHERQCLWLCSPKHAITADTQENHEIKVVGGKGRERASDTKLRYIQEHLAEAELRSEQRCIKCNQVVTDSATSATSWVQHCSPNNIHM